MAQFINETFNGASVDTKLEDFTASFVKHPSSGGSFQVKASGVLHMNTQNTGYTARHVAVPASADHSASVNIFYQDLDLAGVAVRCSATQNTMYKAYFTASNLRLFRVLNGVETELIAPVASGVLAGNWLKLTLRAVGSTIDVLLNNETVPRISVVDNNITATGFVALVGYRATSVPNGLPLDNLTADSVGAVGLEGIGVGQSTAQGSVTTRIDLNGKADATPSANGDLTAAINFGPTDHLRDPVTGEPLRNLTGITITVFTLVGGAMSKVHEFSNCTTDANGMLSTLSHSSLIPGVRYLGIQVGSDQDAGNVSVGWWLKVAA